MSLFFENALFDNKTAYFDGQSKLFCCQTMYLVMESDTCRSSDLNRGRQSPVTPKKRLRFLPTLHCIGFFFSDKYRLQLAIYEQTFVTLPLLPLLATETAADGK